MATVNITPEFARQILAYLSERPLKEVYNLFSGLAGELARAEGMELPTPDEFAHDEPEEAESA